MTSLPTRFPRVSLAAQAAELEARLARQLDDTFRKMTEAQERGLQIPAEKLQDRYNALEDARRHINATRVILFNCA